MSRAWFILLCLLAASCARARPIHYYRLGIPPPTAATAAPRPLTLAVGNIDCPPIMRDGRILYEVGNHEMGAYEYHRWVETPDRMIRNSLVRMLRSSGKYSSVEVQASGVRSDYVVSGRIYEFSERDSAEIHSRVSIEIELRDVKVGRMVWSQVYTREEPVQGKEVSDVVDSLDRNLQQGLSQIASALHQYLDSAK